MSFAAPAGAMGQHESLRDVIDQYRRGLAAMLQQELAAIADQCVSAWGDGAALDRVLLAALQDVPYCQLLYVIDGFGTQVSGNVARGGVDASARGQNLGGRPYLAGYAAGEPFVLSDVYISRVTRSSCITFLYRLSREGETALGCLAADFDLKDLPQLQRAAELPFHWRQIRGDPSIRLNLFNQQRVPSVMDVCLNQVHDIVYELMADRGIFHAKLHYGSSRATLWLNDDPRRYRVHVLEEIINPSVCLAYPGTSYPLDATINKREIRDVLDRFVNLRLGDSVVYLRSASLNLINGLVSLNFSCDGTHYMAAREFLGKDDQFWFGGGRTPPAVPV